MYSRRSDSKCVQAVHEAFQSWVRSRFNGTVVTSTPAKQARPAHLVDVGGGGGSQPMMPVLGNRHKRPRDLTASFNAQQSLSQQSGEERNMKK